MPPVERLRDVRWIVGVDGSDGSEHALRWAISQAFAQSASIRVLRAWQPTIPFLGELDLSYEMDQAAQTAKAALNELAVTLGEVGLTIDWTVKFGHPSSTLLDIAQEGDLLVLGKRGLGGFKRLMLGSVSQQCATHASVPVVVIPSSTDLDGRVDRVVVGMDASDNAEAALRWALRFAQPQTTVHVVGASNQTPTYTYSLISDAVEEVIATADGRGVTLKTSFRHTSAAEALLECSTDADLLVLGARGQGRVVSAILGSVTNRLLHQAPCPVVVVPGSGH